MNFESDAFISYAARDNEALIPEVKGWVQSLHVALERRVGQLLGKQANIYPKLTASDAYSGNQTEHLKGAAALVSVVSPAYVNSDNALKELATFWQAAEAQGGVRRGDKYRAFKVVKTPVPREKQTLELQSLLPYEFFKFDPASGKVRELDLSFGEEARRDFLFRIDDLAHDMCSVLELLESDPDKQSTEGQAVFLAETTWDLREQRDAVRRDLMEHGYTVLPARPLPLAEPTMTGTLREDLSRCRMSIHLIGKNYGWMPEGASKSVLEIQNEIAMERGLSGRFSRLLWIPIGLRVEDERQRLVIEQLRMDPRLQEGADLLETYLEDLRTEILNRLRRKEDPDRTVSVNVARVYLIYDRRDAEAVTPYEDFFFGKGLEVISPIFDGDEAQIREFHEENLRICDGVLIFHGAANLSWVKRKLAELRKIARRGTDEAPLAPMIVEIPPKTLEKERFRTHEAEVVQQWDGISQKPFQSFVAECLRRRPAPAEYHPDLERTIGPNMRLGRYELGAKLGAGGMGEVFSAHDPNLDCKVAIKILRQAGLADEDARRRFREEAKALAKLRDSPNIAVIYDLGQFRGTNYLVMEYVPGQTLAEKLKSGPLKEADLVFFGAQIAEALEVAHEEGVVHRDLKPANVMVTVKRRVKVLDFGLAKILRAQEGFDQTLSFAGTLPYMAPEQLTGERVDARTDLYALGNILFEMAAGRKPFLERSTGRLMHAIQYEPAARLRPLRPELSEELDRIVAKALQKDKDLRYQSATGMRADLVRLVRAGA